MDNALTEKQFTLFSEQEQTKGKSEENKRLNAEVKSQRGKIDELLDNVRELNEELDEKDVEL